MPKESKPDPSPKERAEAGKVVVDKDDVVDETHNPDGPPRGFETEDRQKLIDKSEKENAKDADSDEENEQKFNLNKGLE